MSIASVIGDAGRDRNGALIGYLPVGFPDLDTSIAAAVGLAQAGADVIELGLPYSDPVMDGPVIQRATAEALDRGFRVDDVFEAIRQIRAQSPVRLAVMSYWNLILQHGPARFADDLRAAGGDGVITPDLIPDEAAEWIAATDAAGVERVFLAAPTSPDDRLVRIADASGGFVYVVSTMGVTGARHEVDAHARSLTARLRAVSTKPLCVGIGISNEAQVRDVLTYADGAIVGSALVKALEDGGVTALEETAATLSAGTR